MKTTRAPLRPLDDALATLLNHAAALPATEPVNTFDADRRVLAQDAVSALHVPPHDNSSMDGYALRCADVPKAGTAMPVSQRIAAGSVGAPLLPGTVARIFTGAPVPPGADTVVMQEDCEAVEEGVVRILSLPGPGQWIRRAGEDVSRGTVVLRQGTRLSPAELGMAASLGLDQLLVARRPRVALFSTGDELVMPGSVAPESMPAGAIYNSNRYFLKALLQRLGCEATDFGIVPDQRQATLDALALAARSHDLILTSGGVSVGEEDHIKPAVQSLGSLDLWQIAIKPGKPFAFGHVKVADATRSCHFIGLPGNPVSSFVTYLLLVRPFVLRLQGMRDVMPVVTDLPAHFEWPRADQRREFLRVRRNAAGGLDLFPNQSSGVLTSLVWGDGLVDNPPGRTIARDDPVRFLAFSDMLV
jgi:molybdopterin molybdotransferase